MVEKEPEECLTCLVDQSMLCFTMEKTMELSDLYSKPAAFVTNQMKQHAPAMFCYTLLIPFTLLMLVPFHRELGWFFWLPLILLFLPSLVVFVTTLIVWGMEQDRIALAIADRARADAERKARR